MRESPPLDVDDRIFPHFALGKAYADIADCERSFRHFSQGGALKRKHRGYDEAQVLRDLELTQAGCASEWFARHYGYGDPSPIPVFIIGMPRSGATLVEQILASHPDVHGAGEINDFEMAMGEIGEVGSLALGRPEFVAQISDEDLRRLGAGYLRRIDAATRPERRIVNKTTENFRFAGLISLALPNARIVHVRRNPLDTCVSCFSNLFLNDLPYSYDLAELGCYYRAYEALMNFWRSVLPHSMMIEVQYEDVVADLEGQARRIVAHCGLPWDARCLDFHNHQRSVRTASVAQVRRPLYTSSVGRWRRYDAFLEPLVAALDMAV
ncbi:MAG TPA: sulfotransferase [Roseiarcus sp.]